MPDFYHHPSHAFPPKISRPKSSHPNPHLDTLKSTLHRVQLPPLASRYNPIDDGAHDDAGAHNNTKTPSPSAPQPPKRITHARYSIPYFCAPDIDRTITVLPECIPEGQKPKYKPILAGEYYRMRGALQYRS